MPSFFQPRHARSVILLALVLLASCLPGAHAPKVTPSRTLNLEGEAAGGASAKAFAVVFAGPKGKTVDPGEVTIVFNRPMRPLELAGSESAPPAVLHAAGGAPVKGEWRWMGTSALSFAPASQLPRATEYAVTVPAGTKALDGSVLHDAYAFTFSTPPPKVVRIQPDGQAAQHMTPAQTFELRFNQAVDPREVERAVSLLVGDAKGKKAAFRATYPKQDTPTLIKLTPLAPLPLASAVLLHLDKSLHGLEGPLPVGEVADVELRSYGPIEVRTLNCYRETPHKKCAAKDSLDVELSNRVSEKEWRAHARIDGAELRWQTDADGAQLSEYMRLSPKLRSARSYHLVVSAGLKDEFGQVLTHDAVLPFDTDDEWPAIEVGLTGTVFEAGKSHIHEVPIASVNVPSYELVSAPLDESTIAGFVAGRRAGRIGVLNEVRNLAHARFEDVRSASAINVQAVKKLSLDAVLAGRKGRGVVAFAVRAPVHNESHEELRVVSLTDLAITAKMSRFGSVVWVSRLSDGKAAAGAMVSVRNTNGEVFSTKADASGVALIPADKYNPVKENGTTDDDAIVIAKAGDDWSFREVSEMLSPWRYQPSSDPAGRLTPFGMLFTDRGIYKPGETIRVKGLFRRPLPRGTETPAGREVKFEAFDSQQGKLLVQTARLGAFGEFAVDIAVPASTPLGGVELRAAMEDGPDKWRAGTANAYVQLAAYRPAEFKVSVDPDKPSYIRGDKASFVARGDYLFGAPMSGGSVRFTATRGSSAFAPPGTDGLVVDDNAFAYDLPDASERASELESGKGALSERGDFQGAVSLALPHQRGTEAVSIEAEVEDVSRQTIAGRSTAIVHPGEFYVALEPPKEMFVAKTAALSVEFAAVEPSGKKRVNVPVTVELVRRTWNTVARSSGEYGMRYESKAVDTTVATCAAKSSATLASCTLPLATAGYFVLRATAKDPRGNAVASSTSLY
ncbi:MAG: Ig-like domain-containing protein, partial [Polyangiaceae bacterium]